MTGTLPPSPPPATCQAAIFLALTRLRQHIAEGGLSEVEAIVAAGRVAVTALLGRAPTAAETDELPAVLARRRPDCPPMLSETLALALTRDAALRWGSVDTFVAALEAVVPAPPPPAWPDERLLAAVNARIARGSAVRAAPRARALPLEASPTTYAHGGRS